MSDYYKGGYDFENDIYDFSCPRKHGPGQWWGMHSSAAAVTNQSEAYTVCKIFRYQASILGCPDCRGHYLKYLQKHPPEEAVGTRDGLFYWTVTFRNDVNKRLNRTKGLNLPMYDHKTMYEIFHEMPALPCSGACGGDKSEKEDHKKQTKHSGHHVRKVLGESKPHSVRKSQPSRAGYTYYR